MIQFVPQPEHGYIPLLVVGMVFVNIWAAMKVSAARKKYGIEYPQVRLIILIVVAGKRSVVFYQRVILMWMVVFVDVRGEERQERQGVQLRAARAPEHARAAPDLLRAAHRVIVRLLVLWLVV